MAHALEQRWRVPRCRREEPDGRGGRVEGRPEVCQAAAAAAVEAAIHTRRVEPAQQQRIARQRQRQQRRIEAQLQRPPAAAPRERAVEVHLFAGTGDHVQPRRHGAPLCERLHQLARVQAQRRDHQRELHEVVIARRAAESLPRAQVGRARALAAAAVLGSDLGLHAVQRKQPGRESRQRLLTLEQAVLDAHAELEAVLLLVMTLTLGQRAVAVERDTRRDKRRGRRGLGLQRRGRRHGHSKGLGHSRTGSMWNMALPRTCTSIRYSSRGPSASLQEIYGNLDPL